MTRNRMILAAIATLAALAPVARAQMPPSPQMSPAAQAKMKAWARWRDSHKNVSSVQRTLGAISMMNRDPKTRLTKPQAKAVLAVLKAWRNKPVMTDAQALKVNKQLTASLSITQIKRLATMRESRRFGGPRPGGFGGPRPGGPEGRPRFDPSQMPAPKDYNPLNPKTLPFERSRQRSQERLDTLMKELSAQAK